AVDDDAVFERALLLRTELHSVAHALIHFGEIALVVLRLDEQRTKRALRRDVESRQPKRPQNHELHAERGLADAGLPDDDEGATSAEPAVAENIVRIAGGVVGREPRDWQRLANVAGFVRRFPFGPRTGAEIEREQLLHA